MNSCNVFVTPDLLSVIQNVIIVRLGFRAGAGVKDLLAFWTGCEVLPPLGQNLHVLVDSGKLPSSLPESKSCFHRLTSSPQQTEYAVFKEID